MTGDANRRTVIATLGAGALAAGVQPTTAEPVIHGDVTYAGGAPIPAGYLKVRLDDLRVKNKAQRRLAEVHIRSNGRSERVPFSLNAPASRLANASQLELVARLEREDGWLLARASSHYTAGEPASLTLNAVMY